MEIINNEEEESVEFLSFKLKQAKERAKKARIRRQIREYDREASDPFFPTLSCKINSLR